MSPSPRPPVSAHGRRWRGRERRSGRCNGGSDRARGNSPFLASANCPVGNRPAGLRTGAARHHCGRSSFPPQRAAPCPKRLPLPSRSRPTAHLARKHPHIRRYRIPPSRAPARGKGGTDLRSYGITCSAASSGTPAEGPSRWPAPVRPFQPPPYVSGGRCLWSVCRRASTAHVMRRPHIQLLGIGQPGPRDVNEYASDAVGRLWIRCASAGGPSLPSNRRFHDTWTQGRTATAPFVTRAHDRTRASTRPSNCAPPPATRPANSRHMPNVRQGNPNKG